MRLLAAFITCLDLKPFTFSPTSLLIAIFVCSFILQPLERRCSLTRGVRESENEIDLFDLITL